ncbi:MAG: serine/threonine protein kinase, partial [Myxococcales bacterium]|nr:serine/threonine protein kinase [Myxococcales bacterium]
MTHPGDDRLAAFVHGALETAPLAELSHHLEDCESCRHRLTALKASLSSGPPTVTVSGQVVRRVDDAPPPLPKGARVGRYEVDAEIGRGGMGRVYSAFDPQLSRKVALKLLLAGGGLASDSAGARARLLREAQALAQLSHPNVVAVHDVGPHEDGVFLAMELVEGQTLRAWMAAKPRAWKEALEVLRAAGEGLAAAHAKGLVHRDFKPENVLVGNDGRVRVLDFGLARAQTVLAQAGPSAPGSPSQALTGSTLDSPVTVEGVVAGTAGYVAPELFDGKAADARSDQFAFAVVLYEALFHQRPFEGRTMAEFYRALRERPAQAPRGHQVPAWLTEQVLKALAVEPTARHPSMRALLDAITPPLEARVRRGPLAAVAALALVGVVAAVLVSRRQTHPNCAEDDPLAQLWSAEQRAKVEAALKGAGKADADDVARRVLSLLDGRASAWRTANTQACQALAAASTEAQAESLLRLACLERLKSEFKAMTALLQQADAKMSNHAVGATQSLEVPSRCADPRALMGVSAPVVDPALRLKNEELRGRLDAAKALASAGQTGPALDALDALAAQARREKLPALEADALILSGRLRARTQAFNDARRDLGEALAIANTHGLDLEIFLASARLAFVAGLDRKPREAEPMLKLAASARERLGKDALLEAEFLEARSTVALSQGDQASSLEDRRQVLALRRAALGEDHLETIAALNNMAVGFERMGRLPDAAETLNRARLTCDRALPAGHPGCILIASNEGWTLIGTGRYEEAISILEPTVARAEKYLGAESPPVAIVLSNLTAALARAKRGEAALAAGNRAVALLEKAEDDTSLADTLTARGEAWLALSRPAAAREDCDRALTLGKRVLEKDALELGEYTLCLGRAQLALGQAAEAVATLERSVQIREQSAWPPAQGLARFELAKAVAATGKDGARAKELGQRA